VCTCLLLLLPVLEVMCSITALRAATVNAAAVTAAVVCRQPSLTRPCRAVHITLPMWLLLLLLLLL
jgi:hypothetical protein